MSSLTVFINYAREDIEAARRLYNDLKESGIEPWFDEESLLPGQQWKVAVRKAIKNCRFFIALISANSINKRGFVQQELRNALTAQECFPESETFIIPARLDDCKPSFELLEEIHWVDLFPDWDKGISKILQSMQVESSKKARPYPTGHGFYDLALEDSRDEWPIYQVAFLWHGKEPPTIQEHWQAMNPLVWSTKELLHEAVENGELVVSREYWASGGVTRFVSRDKLRHYAESIGEKPKFLFPEE